MKTAYSLPIITLTVSLLLFSSLSHAHQQAIVVPLGGAVGDATPADVVQGKTFSSQSAGKGATGTMVLPPTAQTFTNSIGMTFNLLPAGTFSMGSPDDEPGGPYADEQPQHQVTLTNAFYMQTTEVTQSQWNTLIVANSLGSNPSAYSGEDKPVESVNWYEAASFANWLSYAEGRMICYTYDTCSGTQLGTDFTCTNVQLVSNCTEGFLATASMSTRPL